MRADDTDESTLISRPRLANGTLVVRITFGSGVSPSDVAFPPPKSEDQVPTVALPNGNTAVLLGSCALDVAPDAGESSLGLIAGLAALGVVLVGGALLVWHQHRSGWGLVHRLRHMREQVPRRLRATMANPSFDRDDGEQILSAVADVCRGFRAVAIGPFTPLAAGQIALRAREQVIVLDDSKPWWKVHLVGQSPATAGLAPSNYLQRLAVHADDGVIAWSDVVLGEELGRGAYGAVYRAMWRGAPVAVKQLRELPEGSEEELEAFQNETRQLYKLRHPHVVQFFGSGVYVAESGQPLPFLVTELLPGGTLRALLASDLALSQPKREAIAYDVVRGMAYMHEQGVMHRDLKSDNVMMAVGADGKRIAKVADLGTAVRFTSGQRQFRASPAQQLTAAADATRTLGAGTPLWMAPEVLDGRHGKATYGPAVDVYSFGIVMWEVHSRKLPFTDVVVKNHFDLSKMIAGGRRPAFPEGLPPPPGWYASLMRKCWATAAAARPTFQTALAIFNKNCQAAKEQALPLAAQTAAAEADAAAAARDAALREAAKLAAAQRAAARVAEQARAAAAAAEAERKRRSLHESWVDGINLKRVTHDDAAMQAEADAADAAAAEAGAVAAAADAAAAEAAATAARAHEVAQAAVISVRRSISSVDGSEA